MTDPDYKPVIFENDISVIELQSALEQEFKELTNGTFECRLVGNGYIDGRNTETKELRATKQVYSNYKTCQNFGINSGNCFLTQDIVGNSQACQGDSGGPLYCDFGNGNKLFGIVSFVSATISDKAYTGFTLPMIY